MKVHKGINYLEGFSIKKGLLMNFVALSLGFKRLFRKQKHATNKRIIPIIPKS